MTPRCLKATLIRGHMPFFSGARLPAVHLPGRPPARRHPRWDFEDLDATLSDFLCHPRSTQASRPRHTTPDSPRCATRASARLFRVAAGFVDGGLNDIDASMDNNFSKADHTITQRLILGSQRLETPRPAARPRSAYHDSTRVRAIRGGPHTARHAA